MERFVIIVNGWKSSTIITKHSILDVAVVLDPPLVLFPSQKMIKLIFIYQFYVEENILLYAEQNKYRRIRHSLRCCWKEHIYQSCNIKWCNFEQIDTKTQEKLHLASKNTEIQSCLLIWALLKNSGTWLLSYWKEQLLLFLFKF